MTESETIANELGLQYYSLDSIGIQSVAYDKSNATRIIEYCRNEVLPVIGIKRFDDNTLFDIVI